MKWKNIALFLSLFPCFLVYGADDSPARWKLKKAIDIRKLIGTDSVEGISLSPDGKFIAYVVKETNSMTIRSLADNSSKSYPMPPQFRGAVEYLEWSDSGRYIVFNENLFRYFYDPDIWIFDTTTKTFSDLTDDGTTENALVAMEKGSIDYLPVWGRNEDRIYYLHTGVRGDERTKTLELFSVVPGKKPERKADLTEKLGGFSVSVRPAVSEDGRSIAFAVSSMKIENPINGIWVLSLDRGTLEMIVPVTALSSGLSDESAGDRQGFSPVAVRWTNNDRGLVVATVSLAGYIFVPEQYSYIDIATKKVFPLADIRDIRSQADMVKELPDGHENNFRFIRECMLLPDGSGCISLHVDIPREKVCCAFMTLPPKGDTPVLIGEFDFRPASYRLPGSVVRIAPNGVALSRQYPYLFEFEKK
jgi:WD40 repeat protein